MSRAKKATRDLPEQLRIERDYVVSTPDINFNTATAESAHSYMAMGIDNSWSQRDFVKNFRIVIKDGMRGAQYASQQEAQADDAVWFLEFDIVGIDPAIVNALRRILIAEIPTVAIEHVFMINNTSIIPCENLAHRLGLVPIKLDPAKLDFRGADEPATDRNTIVFKLKTACRRVGGAIENERVNSDQLEWLSGGSEIPDASNCRFVGDQRDRLGEVGPVHPDILLAKLRPGQEIELEAHCVKGIGREHAKWSPVATAWYRLLPEVVLLQPVVGSEAEELVRHCPAIFNLDGSTKKRAVVKDVATHAAQQELEKLRNLTRDEKWAQRVQLRKKKTHFIFTIESVGILPPDQLFLQAIDILSDKCDKLLNRL
eukprot:jgi/Botrbrau1/12641/Bobra.67_1s0007.1